jgi:cytochrome c-type biogenesis protein CcmH/NrfG
VRKILDIPASTFLAQFLSAILLTLGPAPITFPAEPSPEALMNAGHWKRARPVVEQRYVANPHDAQSVYLLSRVKMAFGDLEGALPLAEKAVELEGSNARYHYQLAAVCGELADRASFFQKAGWAKRFKQEADQAAALDPNNVDARFALMEYYRQAPRLMGGDKQKAHQMVEEITKADPARGYLDAAILVQEEKENNGVEGSYIKALAAGPKNYDVLIGASEFFNSSPAKTDLAEKYAREAREVDPGRARAYSLLASLYAAEERWSALDEVLAESEEKDPDDFSPFYQAARTLLTHGAEFPRAERYLRKYLTQSPEGEAPSLAEARWQLGLVLEKEGCVPEAVAEIETALRLNPELRQAEKDLARLKRKN